jgi:hypothetical protein
VNIGWDWGAIKDAAFVAGMGAIAVDEFTLGREGGFDGDAGARFSPRGNVGNAKLGFATPEPIGLWSGAGSCLVLANFIEPESPKAVLGNFGILVTSNALPAWSRPESLTINWVAR